MSSIANIFRRCCGGTGNGSGEEDDHTVPMAAASSLNMAVNDCPEASEPHLVPRAGDGGSSGSYSHTSGSRYEGSTSYNNDFGSDRGGGVPNNSSLGGGKRRRGVSFAPEGFCLPPSPEIKTSEVLSPRTRARSIIKPSSFSSSPNTGDGTSYGVNKNSSLGAAAGPPSKSDNQSFGNNISNTSISKGNVNHNNSTCSYTSANGDYPSTYVNNGSYAGSSSYTNNASYSSSVGGISGGNSSSISSRSTPRHGYASNNMSLSGDQGFSNAILRDELL